jgi:hypothetical protein
MQIFLTPHIYTYLIRNILSFNDLGRGRAIFSGEKKLDLVNTFGVPGMYIPAAPL